MKRPAKNPARGEAKRSTPPWAVHARYAASRQKIRGVSSREYSREKTRSVAGGDHGAQPGQTGYTPVATKARSRNARPIPWSAQDSA